MCLRTADRVYKKNSRKIVGYKVLERIGRGKYESGFFPGVYTIGKKYERNPAKGKILASGGKRYPVGFHILEKKRDAQGWLFEDNERIVRVEGTGVLAVGKQSGCDKGKCYICKYQKITKSVGDKGGKKWQT